MGSLRGFLRFSSVVVMMGGALGWGSAPVEALPMLRVSDTITTATITDNGPGDSSGVAGVILYLGTLGNASIVVNVDTAQSKPVLGGGGVAQMDLNYAFTSTRAVTLTIAFTDTDFAGPNAGARWHTVANANTNKTTSTLRYQAYLDNSDTPFGTVSASPRARRQAGSGASGWCE